MARKKLCLHTTASSEDPTINLTPLIDIVFVVLIMFILVAPLLELDRIDLAEAPKRTIDDSVIIKEQSPITIHVNENDIIFLNKRPMTIEQLAEALQNAKKTYPLSHPQVFHDRKAHFGTYQAVKNVIEAAGFDDMDIILKPA